MPKTGIRSYETQGLRVQKMEVKLASVARSGTR